MINTPYRNIGIETLEVMGHTRHYVVANGKVVFDDCNHELCDVFADTLERTQCLADAHNAVLRHGWDLD